MSGPWWKRGESVEDFVKIAEEKMKKSIETLKKNFATLRTGRASPALLDHIQVEYYGTNVPIRQLASISVPEPKLIVIQAYDKASTASIEKAILKSDLGITPKVEAGVIRLPVPPLNEERRKELAKIAHKYTEEAKVAIRNIRRDAIEHLKAQKEKKELSEDAEKTREENIAKITTKYTEEAEKILKAKEAEILEI